MARVEPYEVAGGLVVAAAATGTPCAFIAAAFGAWDHAAVFAAVALVPAALLATWVGVAPRPGHYHPTPSVAPGDVHAVVRRVSPLCYDVDLRHGPDLAHHAARRVCRPLPPWAAAASARAARRVVDRERRRVGRKNEWVIR